MLMSLYEFHSIGGADSLVRRFFVLKYSIIVYLFGEMYHIQMIFEKFVSRSSQTRSAMTFSDVTLVRSLLFLFLLDLRLMMRCMMTTNFSLLEKATVNLTMKRKITLLHVLFVLLPWVTLSFSTRIFHRRVKKKNFNGIISLSTVEEGTEIPELGKDGLYHVNTPMQHR